jgi:hypothetical protein
MDPTLEQTRDEKCKLIDFSLALPFLLLEQGSKEINYLMKHTVLLLWHFILSISYEGENITKLIE